MSGPRFRARLTLAARLLLVLCLVASFSTALALILQDRSLSRELRRAARDRLEGSAAATQLLLQSHLEALLARYRASAATPQTRANLEAGHGPTLAYFANHLARQQGADLILFADPAGAVSAFGGEEALVPAALAHLRRGRARPAEPDGEKPSASLVAHAGGGYAVAIVPLRTGDTLLGRLVALESIAPEIIAGWSKLCGAAVSIGAVEEPELGPLEAVVRRFGDLEVRVSGSLEPEREALTHSRRSLLAAGLLALLAAFAASGVLASGLVRPIRAIQRATERIGRGDLAHRLAIDRSDEIGDVARAFNGMLERLQATQERLASAQHLARLGNWWIDIESRELHGSDELRRMLEVGAEESLTFEALLVRVHPDDRGRVRHAVETCLRTGRPFRLDHRARARNGADRVFHLEGERLARDGRPPRLEGIVQDVTERKLVEDQVRYLNYHDGLTGLGNRRLFRDRLRLALEEARREGSRLAVLILDVDDFKVINDTLGHSAGDRLLAEVADRVVNAVLSRDELRRSGSHTSPPTIARLGGDEFAVLLHRLADPQDAGRVARRILDALAEPFDAEGHETVLSGSIGITMSPDDGTDAEALLRNSDTAMYHAKRTTGSNYEFYTESMKAAVFKRLLVENRLRRAIERDELRLYYQPKLALATGDVTGLEALVRWRDSDLGIVLPDEFVPLAEEAGLISALGEWVLRHATRQARTWQVEGLSIRVAVNLSAQQVEDPGFVPSVARILEETGLQPGQLELEITESTLMRDAEAAIALFRELRRLGILLSLDDFGTGYSSLSHLRRLPIDALKIDRSFVRRIATDPDDAALAGAIVSMAKALRLRVVVEGVETEEQCELLEQMGCDEIQGFLASPPVPADQVRAMLREVQGGRWPKSRPGRRSDGRGGSGRRGR